MSVLRVQIEQEIEQHIDRVIEAPTVLIDGGRLCTIAGIPISSELAGVLQPLFQRGEAFTVDEVESLCQEEQELLEREHYEVLLRIAEESKMHGKRIEQRGACEVQFTAITISDQPIRYSTMSMNEWGDRKIERESIPPGTYAWFSTKRTSSSIWTQWVYAKLEV